MKNKTLHAVIGSDWETNDLLGIYTSEEKAKEAITSWLDNNFEKIHASYYIQTVGLNAEMAISDAWMDTMKKIEA